MAGAGAVAPAAAAPQAHLGMPPACLPAHLPVPTAHEAELLRQLDVLTVNISPACMQLSGKEKQLVQKTLNDLSFGLPVIVETTGTTDEARNLAATTIQAHLRGRWTRRLIQAAGMLEAAHIIQQAYYNFVLRRRVATLAPYTLSDKGPLSHNLRMQSVRPTLATESSTADEPPLLRETKLREHTSEDEKPQATDVQGATPSARAPAGDQEGTVPAIISSKSPTRHGCQANGALDGSNISSCTKDAGLDSSLYSRAECLAAVTIQRAALPFITRRLSAAIAQLRVRLAAASSLGHTDAYTQTAQRTSGPTGTEHTGKVAAGQMRGGKVTSRVSAKRRRACNETDSWSDSDDVDQPGADDDC